MLTKMPDARDQKILDLLEENARLPISELSKLVNLSPTAVRQRIARMEKDEIIEGYTIRRKSLSPDEGLKVMIILTLTGSFCKKLMSEFGHLSEIQKFWSLTGELDAAILLHVDNVDRLKDITNRFSDHELVKKLQSHIITETHLDR